MSSEIRALALAACLLLGMTHMSTVAAADADLLEAIRSGNPGPVQAALRAGADPNARDEAGATALMHAVVSAPIECMRQLLNRGADVNAANSAGATALMWAGGDTAKVRLLLDRGANPNDRARDGSTALVTASRFGNSGAMRLLLARGADPKASANGNLDLLRMAYGRDDPDMRLVLSEAGIPLTEPAQVPTALAANIGNLSMLRRLLDSGADANEQVRLGITQPTVAVAAHAGAVDALMLLITRGADPSARGSRGLTPLMIAAATNQSDVKVIRALVDHGAEVDARDDAGRTALDWALTRGETDVASLLRHAGASAMAPSRSLPPVGASREVRAAIQAALARLQPVGPAFHEQAKCVSCHHQSLPAIAVALADRHGVTIDRRFASHPTEATLAGWRAQEEQLRAGGVSGGVPAFLANAIYGLFAMAEEGVAHSSASDAVVLRLAAFQHADGRWDGGGGGVRPPLSGSPISQTALAVRALAVYAPPGRRSEMTHRITRARRFLQASVPADTDDEAFKLLGLVWSGASVRDVSRQRERVLAHQMSDGGWAQWPGMAPDAYATGQSLYALHASGVSPTGVAYQRGAQFLLRTQLEDGTWFVKSRAIGFQRYFETGFPHGEDQFISAAATSWASIALAYTLER